MVQAGIEPPAKHACVECGGPIPRWRNGRLVSSATRFCSSRCKQNHWKKSQTTPHVPAPVLRRETAKKCPSNGGLRGGVKNPRSERAS
jgi:hypothetical protein